MTFGKIWVFVIFKPGARRPQELASPVQGVNPLKQLLKTAVHE